MKVLHITPHLGGGVGKAHAALCTAGDKADRDTGRRHYVLLEAPRDHRHVDAIGRNGATVSIAPDTSSIHELMARADIVQFEWWNHPLMCGLLAGPSLPEMRSVFWSHVSGINAPLNPAGLVEAADRFVFSSTCSRLAPNLSGLTAEALARTHVINSGFGHCKAGMKTGPGEACNDEKHGIAYLGTVEFTKMSPAMMDVVDRINCDDVIINVWGGVDANSPVHKTIAAMAHPDRFRLRGHSHDPVAALSQSSIFLYLLQPFHFGTAENALVEAMSLGCAPLVMANPCEMAIVRDGETGLVATSAAHAAQQLNWMLAHPQEVRRMGEAARMEVCELKTPDLSMAAFRALWQAAMAHPKRKPGFAADLGSTPRDWYETLQGGCKADAGLQAVRSASKGSLAHFRACYPDLDLVPG